MKKLTKFFLTFIVVAVLFSLGFKLIYAEDGFIGDDIGETGPATGSELRQDGEWGVSNEGQGTEYKFCFLDENGQRILPPVTIRLPDGYDGSGGMKGYGLGKEFLSGTKNDLPNGEVIITAQDIINVLNDLGGYEDIVRQIENGKGYVMTAQQYFSLIKPDGTLLPTNAAGFEAMYNFWLENGLWYDNIALQIGALKRRLENAWDDNQYKGSGVGVYWRKPLPGVDGEVDGEIDGDIDGDTDGDPEDPPEEEPETQNREWSESWNGGSVEECGKADATLSIDNAHFGVASGKPIPTSESLTAAGDTNAVGKINNMQEWTYTVTSGLASATFNYGYYRYTWSESWVKPEKNSSGEIIKEGYWKDNGTSRAVVASVGETVDEKHKKVWYEGPGPLMSVGYYPGWGSASYDYLYTGYATYKDGSTVSAFNEAMGGNISIPVRGGASIEKQDEDQPQDRGNYWTGLNSGMWLTDITVEEAMVLMEAWGIAQPPEMYIEQPEDGILLMQYSGATKSYEANCVVTTDDFGKGRISFSQTRTVPLINNKSVGTEYPTTNAKLTVDTKTYPISGVNGVKVHTPIFNELKVEPSGKNQLENLNLAKDSNSVQLPIVTLGDTAKITVNIKGRTREKDSYYYAENVYSKKVGDSSGYPLSKYVKEVRLECGLCGKEYVYNRTTGENTFDEWTSNKDSFVHNCVVQENRKDNTIHSAKSIVKAENIPVPEDSVEKQTDLEYNEPDKEYIVERTAGVYVAGKMYDLEVRATDDPGWKDFAGKAVQMLNKLPVGEKGDNAASAYKYGIKLGYRAYFDLKTLSTATGSIKITPKIYYVDLNGNVNNNVDIWYKKGSLTTYKKLSDNDIIINMSMNTTYGEKYNTVYNEEKTKTLSLMNKAINYAKMDNIGGLKNITLDSTGATANALMTKYKGAYQTEVYSIVGGTLTRETNYTNSRRWYGEVYMPATTVVAKSGTKVEDVARGENTYKNGYLLIAFDTIETTLADGTTRYLRYSTARNPKGVEDRPYILINEKAGKGKTVPITLPNGKQINIAGLGTDFYETSAPIIIYDVSLRANNDYEPTETH